MKMLIDTHCIAIILSDQLGILLLKTLTCWEAKNLSSATKENQSEVKLVISWTTMSITTFAIFTDWPGTGWKWPKRRRPPVMKTAGAEAMVSAWAS